LKVLESNHTEYKIYKALKLLKNKIPNMIKIYGSFGCVISKKKYKKIRDNFAIKLDSTNKTSITNASDIKLCESYDENQFNEQINVNLKFVALVKACKA
jgi:hypothetical protein